MAIVSVETVLLVLLVVLVAALLRSHAEILRRLGPEDASAPRMPAPSGFSPPPGVPAPSGVPAPPAGIRTATEAPELAGATPSGDAVSLSLDRGPTLLAFLSSGCTSCAAFFETLGERHLMPGLETVIVTRGSDLEQRTKLRRLPGDQVPVVMSSQAWADYAVPGSPYFVLVQDGAVRGEGVATTWHALASLVSDAIAEEADAASEDRGIEERLAAAGVGPDHPSLYPGRRG